MKVPFLGLGACYLQSAYVICCMLTANFTSLYIVSEPPERRGLASFEFLLPFTIFDILLPSLTFNYLLQFLEILPPLMTFEYFRQLSINFINPLKSERAAGTAWASLVPCCFYYIQQ